MSRNEGAHLPAAKVQTRNVFLQQRAKPHLGQRGHQLWPAPVRCLQWRYINIHFLLLFEKFLISLANQNKIVTSLCCCCCCCVTAGVSQIRLATSGKPLPSAAKVAENIHSPKKAATGYLTTLSSIWAQFVLNDISYPVTFAGIRTNYFSDFKKVNKGIK